MDILKYNSDRSNTGEWVTIKHPTTGADTDIQILAAGTDSAVYKKAFSEVVSGRVLYLQDEGAELTYERKAKEDIGIVVACTLEWKNVEENGKALKCETANVEKVYKEYGWIYEQVDKFITIRKNFLGE